MPASICNPLNTYFTAPQTEVEASRWCYLVPFNCSIHCNSLPKSNHPKVEIVLLPLISLLVSGLTFFTGFGLGSLLLPLFIWKFGAASAVPMVATVHLLNSCYKVFLTYKQANREILLKFGVPALVSAAAGAWLLVDLSEQVTTIHPYSSLGWNQEVTLLKLVVGLSMVVIAIIEASGWFKSLGIAKAWFPLGGTLSGFFGGLTGHQGAFRTIFLLKAGLSKEELIASGAVLACVIDVCRITVYASLIPTTFSTDKLHLLALCAGGALLGTTLGNRFLKKMTLPVLERIITTALVLFGSLLALGVL